MGLPVSAMESPVSRWHSILLVPSFLVLPVQGWYRFQISRLESRERSAQFRFRDICEWQARPLFDRLAEALQEHHDVIALATWEVANFVVVADHPDERVEVQRLGKCRRRPVAQEQGVVLVHFPVAEPPACMGNMRLDQQSQGNGQA